MNVSDLGPTALKNIAEPMRVYSVAVGKPAVAPKPAPRSWYFFFFFFSICLSEDAYRQVKSRLDMNVSDLGPTALKNIAEPLRVYSIAIGKPAVVPKPKPAPQSWFVPVAAALAALIVAAGAAWYLTAGKPAAVVATSAPAPAARPGVPTVAVLPFANVTGNPQYDTLTQRIGQKTMDAAGNATIWRIVGRPGGAAGSAGDPIEAWRQLNADYVVTGNLEAER